MNLTAHFKKLVKDGLGLRNIVKLLLYTECIREIDSSTVKLRRRHRRVERSTTDSSGKSNLSRQDALDNSDDELVSSSDGGSSCTQSSFGFMRFQTGKKSTLTTETDYETFIDYGESADCTKQIFDECLKRQKSSISINRDSDGSFVAVRVPGNKEAIETRDSLPMYSKPVKKVVLKTPSRDSVVHVSTARLDIGMKKSDNVEEIEVEKRFTEARHQACEDLVNLDDSLIINNPLPARAIVDERHSMPTLFVGNRFNSSDMTEVYIPSYKFKQDNAVINKPVVESSQSSASTTTHSSSIDLPAVVPVPDNMNVELLYNFHPFERTNQVKKDIIRPPSMFDNSDRISLTKEVSPFNKHLLNSDKKLNPTRQSVTKEESPRRSNSIKRCISYQYLKLKYNSPRADESEISKKCECCSSSRCPSPRSSDSGVAGSCTISSPDPPQNTTEPEFLHNVSTALRHSNSSHNFGRFGTMSFVEHDPEHDSGQFGDISLTKDEFNNPLGFENMFELSTSRDTVKRQTRCQSAERSTELNRNNADGNYEAVFKTGLYAHWWKKEKLPTIMLRDLIASNRNQNQRHFPRQLDGWGSGKTN